MLILQLLAAGLVAAQSKPRLAPDAKGPLTPDGATTDSIVSSVLQQLNNMFNRANSNTICGICKDALGIAKSISTISDGAVLGKVIEGLCGNPKFEDSKACRLPHNAAMAIAQGHSNMLNDAGNVLTIMDPQSVDGDLFCHHFIFGSCPAPDMPDADLSSWWPPKPANAREPDPSGHTFNVLHLSDIHFQKGYQVGSEAQCADFMCCSGTSKYEKNANPSFPAPIMGYYKCDSPDALIRSTMEHVTNGRFHYDFALFTGDMVDHNPLLVSYEESIEQEEASLKYMKDYLGGIPVYPVLGNHDTYPFSQVAQDASGYANLFSWNSDLMAHLWEEYGWIDSDAAQMVKEHYGGFALTTRQGLRVISLNSNFWYTWNMYNYWNTTEPDTSGIFRFLANELLDCENNGQRAWVIAHVPPNGDDALAMPSTILTQIVERFSPHVIAAVFFGHTHQDEFQLVYRTGSASTELDEGDKVPRNALMTAWISQSITPLTNFNPGWRYYEVDSATFSIMDSHNYYTRLNDSFPDNLDYLVWEHLYSARASYAARMGSSGSRWWPDAAPLNATFWHYVAQRIRKDSEFAQLYLDNGYRRSPYTPECEHDETCQDQNYCYVSSFNPRQSKTCIAHYIESD